MSFPSRALERSPDVSPARSKTGVSYHDGRGKAREYDLHMYPVLDRTIEYRGLTIRTVTELYDVQLGIAPEVNSVKLPDGFVVPLTTHLLERQEAIRLVPWELGCARSGSLFAVCLGPFNMSQRVYRRRSGSAESDGTTILRKNAASKRDNLFS